MEVPKFEADLKVVWAAVLGVELWVSELSATASQGTSLRCCSHRL